MFSEVKVEKCNDVEYIVFLVLCFCTLIKQLLNKTAAAVDFIFYIFS